MPKKKPKTGKPKVHKDLKGFEITINEFGEIKSNMNIEKLNDFLDKNVEDKKLVDRSGKFGEDYVPEDEATETEDQSEDLNDEEADEEDEMNEDEAS